MRLTKKGEYGITAMLALSKDIQGGLTVAEIGRQQNIPAKYLEHILVTLKKVGLLVGKRGVGGGYVLAKSPDQIILGDVIRAIDGPLAPMSCVSKKCHVECPEEATCGLHSVMLDVRNAIAGILDKTTLKDVVVKTSELMQCRNAILNYSI